MRHSYLRQVIGVCLLGAALSTSVYSQPATSSSGDSKESKAKPSSVGLATPGDLKAACQAELSARDRYLVYASKADEEGYGPVASIFRAVARGEEIHARNLASLLSPTGEIVTAKGEPVKPLSTEENLQTALADQRYERDVMYPQLVKQLRQEKNKNAERTLSRNMAAEPLHQAWYAQALSDLDGFKGNNIDFLVCPVCGNVVRALHEAKCPACSTPKEKFERVH